MPYYFYIWTDEIIDHIEQHGISQDDFEGVVSDPERVERSRSSGDYIAFGSSSSGELLACVYKMIDDMTVEPVTAFDPRK